MCAHILQSHTQSTQSHEFLKTILHKPIHCRETQPAEDSQRKKYPAKLGQFALNYIVYLFIYSKGASVGTAATLKCKTSL